MEQLNDYRGSLIPGLKIEDFSPEVLARMVRTYCRMYQAMDGFWYLTIMDKINNETAFDMDVGTWEKVCPYEMKRITELLDIHGNDVSTLMKAMQLIPWFISSEYGIEMINDNHAILTVTRCTTLLALEREGKGREKEITGYHPNTTNNRMELMAAIKALEQLSRPSKVRIYTDSNYLVKGMTSWLFQWEKNNWKNARKRPVLNRDLWEKLLELSRTHNIEWHWIKGHFGHPENERCDMLAKKAIKKCVTTAWHKKKEEL